jgi:hypothetical protein
MVGRRMLFRHVGQRSCDVHVMRIVAVFAEIYDNNQESDRQVWK